MARRTVDNKSRMGKTLVEEKPQHPIIEDFQGYLQVLLDTPDESLVSEAILEVRLATSVENSPPLQEIIDVGLVEVLIHLGYKRSLSVDDQVNVLWILTNVCSGTSSQTNYVIENNGLDLFIRSCNSPYPSVVSQAFWGIGNIAGDSIIFRNQLLELGCVPIVCSTLSKENFLSEKDQSTAIWVLSNMTQGKPVASYELVQDMIPFFIRYQFINHPGSRIDAIWGLSYISEQIVSHDTLIINNIGQELRKTETIEQKDFKLILPIMRIIGNLATGNDSTIDYLIREHLLSWLIEQLRNVGDNSQYARKVLKEGFWSLSNFAAGTSSQQMHLIQIPNFRALVEQYLSEQRIIPLEIAKELYFIIGNLSTSPKVCILMIQFGWHQLWIKNRLNYKQSIYHIGLDKTFYDGILNLTKHTILFGEDSKQEILNSLIILADNDVDEVASEFIQKILSNLQMSYVPPLNKMEEELNEDKALIQIENNNIGQSHLNAVLAQEMENLQLSTPEPGPIAQQLED